MNEDIDDAKFAKQMSREVANWNVRDELKHLSVEEIRKNFQPKFGYAVALMNVDGGLNIGTIIRTSVIFGADVVYIVGKRRFDRRSTVGAHNYIHIEFVDDDFDKFNEKVTGDGYNPVCIEQGGQSIHESYFVTNGGKLELSKYRVFKYLIAPCIMFGSEREGIPQKYLDAYPSYSIPQYGCMRSLNVASAAAIALAKYVEH